MEASFDDAPEADSTPVILTSERPHLAGEPDDGLLTYMALKEIDPQMAEDACVELHKRHSRLIAGWCSKRRFETFGEAVQDWVNQTFARAFNKAGSFSCEAKLPSETKTKLVQGWLFSILEHLFLERCRREAREKKLRDSDVNGEWLANVPNPSQIEAEDDGESVSTGRKALVVRFMEGLVEDDRKLLVITGQYYDVKLKRVEIPPDIRHAIHSELGVTEGSLRVRRNRLLNRLETFILENEQTITVKK
jgi:DNA-directed RNA polymerase specialized sigma24 family protein